MSGRGDDAVKELWDAYYTLPEKMEGAEASSQHNAMQQQLEAFEKLLLHAMSRFSNERYYTTLKSLSQKQRSKNPARRGKIESVSQLQKIKGDLEFESSRRGARRELESTVKYLEGVFEDLQYLKELKKYFDEKIYSCLYQYFYDPKFETSDDEDDGDSWSRKKKKSTSDDINFSELSDKKKLGQAISQLQDINTKWDSLLSEDELDEYMFDSDSYHEISQYKDFKSFELILRLFPDLFVKAYKSTEVAKTWWTTAEKELPSENRSATDVDFNYKVSAIEHMVATLETDIKEEEELLVSEQESLDVLQSREGRYTTLNENCAKVEEAKQEADTNYNNMKWKRQSLVEEKRTDNIEWLDMEINTAHDELQLLTYQHKILSQDLDVEMLVRPEMIRYLGSLEEKVVALERSLSQKKNSKDESEKQLLATRRNLHSMKDIMISRSNTLIEPNEQSRGNYSSNYNDDSRDSKRYDNNHISYNDHNDRDRYEDHDDNSREKDTNEYVKYNDDSRDKDSHRYGDYDSRDKDTDRYGNDDSRDKDTNRYGNYDSRDRDDKDNDRYDSRDARDSNTRYNPYDQQKDTQDTRHTNSKKEDTNFSYSSRSEKKSTGYSSPSKPWKPKPAYVRRTSKK